MSNKPEQINGRLLQFFGVWKVQSGYGTFPLAPPFQNKLDESANGAWVEGVVEKGLVTEYHFAKETL